MPRDVTQRKMTTLKKDMKDSRVHEIQRLIGSLLTTVKTGHKDRWDGRVRASGASLGGVGAGARSTTRANNVRA